VTITEEFQKRQAEKPDTYTLSWWNSQYQEVHKALRGATHAVHLVAADNEDLGKRLTEAHELIHKLYAAAELDRAKIGELQAELLKLKERLERQAGFLNQLKNKAPKEKA
jgi:hypothetical protein